MNATITKLTKEFDQKAYDKYVAREVKAMQKARAKGHRDFVNMTDDEILKGAEALARIYNAGAVYR